MKSSAFAKLSAVPSVKAKFSAVNGLTKLEGVGAAVKYMDKVASLSPTNEFIEKIAEQQEALGKFIH